MRRPPAPGVPVGDRDEFSREGPRAEAGGVLKLHAMDEETWLSSVTFGVAGLSEPLKAHSSQAYFPLAYAVSRAQAQNDRTHMEDCGEHLSRLFLRILLIDSCQIPAAQRLKSP